MADFEHADNKQKAAALRAVVAKLLDADSRKPQSERMKPMYLYHLIQSTVPLRSHDKAVFDSSIGPAFSHRDENDNYKAVSAFIRKRFDEAESTPEAISYNQAFLDELIFTRKFKKEAITQMLNAEVAKPTPLDALPKAPTVTPGAAVITSGDQAKAMRAVIMQLLDEDAKKADKRMSPHELLDLATEIPTPYTKQEKLDQEAVDSLLYVNPNDQYNAAVASIRRRLDAAVESPEDIRYFDYILQQSKLLHTRGIDAKDIETRWAKELANPNSKIYSPPGVASDAAKLTPQQYAQGLTLAIKGRIEADAKKSPDQRLSLGVLSEQNLSMLLPWGQSRHFNDEIDKLRDIEDLETRYQKMRSVIYQELEALAANPDRPYDVNRARSVSHLSIFFHVDEKVFHQDIIKAALGAKEGRNPEKEEKKEEKKPQQPASGNSDPKAPPVTSPAAAAPSATGQSATSTLMAGSIGGLVLAAIVGISGANAIMTLLTFALGALVVGGAASYMMQPSTPPAPLAPSVPQTPRTAPAPAPAKDAASLESARERFRQEPAAPTSEAHPSGISAPLVPKQPEASQRPR